MLRGTDSGSEIQFWHLKEEEGSTFAPKTLPDVSFWNRSGTEIRVAYTFSNCARLGTWWNAHHY